MQQLREALPRRANDDARRRAMHQWAEVLRLSIRTAIFGLAAAVADPDLRITRTGCVVGTPSYMSPEQARGAGGRVDARSDVFSLGVVLYELVTGRLPFVGEGVLDVLQAVVDHDPIPPRSLDPSIDKELEAIILKALEKDITLRYQAAGDLARNLENLIRGDPITAAPSRLRWTGDRLVKRRVLLAGAAASLALVGVYGIWALIGRHRDAVPDEDRAAELTAEGESVYRSAINNLALGGSARLRPRINWRGRRGSSKKLCVRTRAFQRRSKGSLSHMSVPTRLRRWSSSRPLPRTPGLSADTVCIVTPRWGGAFLSLNRV